LGYQQYNSKKKRITPKLKIFLSNAPNFCVETPTAHQKTLNESIKSIAYLKNHIYAKQDLIFSTDFSFPVFSQVLERKKVPSYISGYQEYKLTSGRC